MLPKYHIITGGILTILLYLLLQITIFQAAIIFFGNIFIDIDHAIFYYFKKKKNPFNAYRWFVDYEKKFKNLSIEEKKRYEKPLIVFHGIEFWLLLALLSLINSFFLWFLVGVAFHMIFDFIEMIYIKENFYTKFSQICVIIKNKNKKKL